LMTRDTVIGATPAAAATSVIFTAVCFAVMVCSGA
jgi:hypothetical protein